MAAKRRKQVRVNYRKIRVEQQRSRVVYLLAQGYDKWIAYACGAREQDLEEMVGLCYKDRQKWHSSSSSYFRKNPELLEDMQKILKQWKEEWKNEIVTVRKNVREIGSKAMARGDDKTALKAWELLSKVYNDEADKGADMVRFEAFIKEVRGRE